MNPLLSLCDMFSDECAMSLVANVARANHTLAGRLGADPLEPRAALSTDPAWLLDVVLLPQQRFHIRLQLASNFALLQCSTGWRQPHGPRCLLRVVLEGIGVLQLDHC